jgi:hypothetical protein
MKKILTLSFIGLGLGLLGTPVGAAEAGADGKAAFVRLKALVGDWDARGDSPSGFPLRIEYRLTGAGSALTERVFAGTDHEMTTVYYLDGNDLVLTHYCAGANQPHMKLVAGGAEGQLKFDFVSGSNIDPQKTSHMHSALFSSIAKDKVEATWSAVDAGKPAGSHTFYMVRAAAPAAK